MNKLKHALNGNMALQAACIAMAGTALTFLMRRNRTVVVDPIYDGGELTRARSSIVVPTVPDLAEETAAADTAANAVGGNIATIITQIREANEAFQRTLATERTTFLRTLQTERLTAEQNLETERRNHEAAMRTAAAERPRNPELKVEPPEFYEGDPAEIDTWLRRMTYYFGQVRLTNNDQRIAYAVQRIRKGSQNRAGNWANRLITEMAMSDEEAGKYGTRFPGRAYSKQIHRDGAPAEPATAEHEAWEAHEFIHHPPFITWVEFIAEAKKYFLTTETRDHAMKKL